MNLLSYSLFSVILLLSTFPSIAKGALNALPNGSKKQKMGVIAHRGFSSKAPENTMASLKKSFHSGISHAEIDVQLSQDGEVILLHDSTLGRTTNGHGKVADKTFKELNQLDAGQWFSSQFKGEKIPSLQEVLKWLPRKDFTLIIEIKSSKGSDGIESKVASLIKQSGKSKQIWLKSFDKKVLQKLHSYVPEIPKVFVFLAHNQTLGITLGTKLNWGRLFSELKLINVSYLQPHSFFLTKSLAKKLKYQGFKIIAWGVNTKRRLNQMKERKVDFIETDYPVWAIQNL